MAARSDLAARVADDLDRSDLTTQVDAAISDAVAHYESERLPFNEASNVSVSFSASVDFMALSALPVLFTKIDRLRMNYSGGTSLTDLTRRDYDWIMDSQDLKTVCKPYEYCVYARRIQFESAPDQNYTGVLDGVRQVSATASLALSTSAAAWFNEGKKLIRARAKAELYMNVIREDGASDQAGKFTAVEQREYRALKQKLNTHNTGRVRATDW